MAPRIWGECAALPNPLSPAYLLHQFFTSSFFSKPCLLYQRATGACVTRVYRVLLNEGLAYLSDARSAGPAQGRALPQLFDKCTLARARARVQERFRAGGVWACRREGAVFVGEEDPLGTVARGEDAREGNDGGCGCAKRGEAVGEDEAGEPTAV